MHICACIYVFMHICTFWYAYIHVCCEDYYTQKQTQKKAHRHTHTHTYIHTHIQTQTPLLPPQISISCFRVHINQYTTPCHSWVWQGLRAKCASVCTHTTNTHQNNTPFHTYTNTSIQHTVTQWVGEGCRAHTYINTTHCVTHTQKHPYNKPCHTYIRTSIKHTASHAYTLYTFTSIQHTMPHTHTNIHASQHATRTSIKTPCHTHIQIYIYYRYASNTPCRN